MNPGVTVMRRPRPRPCEDQIIVIRLELTTSRDVRPPDYSDLALALPVATNRLEVIDDQKIASCHSGSWDCILGLKSLKK
ncbi:hypothetical protein J6590_016901 [Homalodisca vitripennis]|nr:hypothetical protein J6590_016901 [Homalodisca vitripennis]